jgi:hypothetical protein
LISVQTSLPHKEGRAAAAATTAAAAVSALLTFILEICWTKFGLNVFEPMLPVFVEHYFHCRGKFHKRDVDS